MNAETAIKNVLVDAAADYNFSLIVTIVRDTKLSFSTLRELQHEMKLSIARMNVEFERETAQFINALRKQ
jgi:hypothetical protein